jgi:antitoxin CptB
MEKVSVEKIKALKWQCRRGMLELDILLKRFFEKIEKQEILFDEKRYENFSQLLALSDPEIYDYITQPSTVPVNYQALIHALKS